MAFSPRNEEGSAFPPNLDEKIITQYKNKTKQILCNMRSNSAESTQFSKVSHEQMKFQREAASASSSSGLIRHITCSLIIR